MQPVDDIEALCKANTDFIARIMHAFIQSEEYPKYCTIVRYGGPEAAYAIVENFVREMAT